MQTYKGRIRFLHYCWMSR